MQVQEPCCLSHFSEALTLQVREPCGIPYLLSAQENCCWQTLRLIFCSMQKHNARMFTVLQHVVGRAIVAYFWLEENLIASGNSSVQYDILPLQLLTCSPPMPPQSQSQTCKPITYYTKPY